MVGRSGLSCLCRVAAYIACLVPTSLSIGEGTFGSGGWGDDGSRKRVSRFLRRLGQEDAFFQDCGANVGELDFCGVDGVSGFPDPDSNLAPPTGASRSSHGGTHRRTSRWVRVTASGQGRARRRLLNPERHTSLDRWVQLALAGVAVSVTTRARGSDRSLARSRLPRFIRGEKSRRRTRTRSWSDLPSTSGSPANSAGQCGCPASCPRSRLQHEPALSGRVVFRPKTPPRGGRCPARRAGQRGLFGCRPVMARRFRGM